MSNYLTTHYLEIFATLTGVISVYLVARENIFTWVFGLICVCLYFIIFYNVKLYADMCLQIVFFALQLYGLYQWLYGGQHRTTLPIRSATVTIYFVSILAAILLFIGIVYLLQAFTDSTTVYIDAFTTALSLVAQGIMGRKWLQHWLIWMTVDIISIRMYIVKELYLTSGLYCLFLMLCLFGYIQWRKRLVNHHFLSNQLTTSSGDLIYQ